jgi:hypothetical protein
MSYFTFGETPKSEIQQLKSDVDEDYIIIYQDDWGADRLSKTLSLYDNIDLKGEPIFIITPKEISEGKQHYKFSDSFQGSCKPSCNYKFIPIDFVRIYFRNLAIAVKDYKNGIARVEHGKKSYFFKYDISWATEYNWRHYKEKAAIQKLLDEDPSYAAFVEELNKCIKKKDLKCLAPFLDHKNLSINDVEGNAKKRAVYEDVELCEKFEQYRRKNEVGMDDVPDEMLQGIKNIDFLWEKMSYNLNLKNADLYEDFEVKDFGNRKHLSIVKKLKIESCGSWLDLSLGFFKQNNKWMIIDLGLSAFTD